LGSLPLLIRRLSEHFSTSASGCLSIAVSFGESP
jgi:hypothetical protein